MGMSISTETEIVKSFLGCVWKMLSARCASQPVEKFFPDGGAVAGYDNRIRDKSPPKMGRADCRNDFSDTL